MIAIHKTSDFKPRAAQILDAAKTQPQYVIRNGVLFVIQRVDKIATDTIAAMRLPDVVRKMSELGTPLVGSRPEEFRAYVAKEIDKWAEAVKVSGASAD